jgi:hypothetical protein
MDNGLDDFKVIMGHGGSESMEIFGAINGEDVFNRFHVHPLPP